MFAMLTQYPLNGGLALMAGLNRPPGPTTTHALPACYNEWSNSSESVVEFFGIRTYTRHSWILWAIQGKISRRRPSCVNACEPCPRRQEQPATFTHGGKRFHTTCPRQAGGREYREGRAKEG